MERAVEDYAENLAPIAEAHLLEPLLAAQRGVVDENIDAAEALDRGRHHRLDRLGVGDVGQARERPAAFAFDLMHYRLDFVAVRARVDDDRGAGRGQLEGNGAADVASGPVTTATRPESWLCPLMKLSPRASR